MGVARGSASNLGGCWAIRRRKVGTVRRTLFRNSQWEVTKFGIASRLSAAPCRYEIDAERLLATEIFGERQLYAWPVHMARMRWVDPSLFFQGFTLAVEAHGERYAGKLDLALLEQSFDEALRKRTRFRRPQTRASRRSHDPGSSAAS